MKKIDLDTLKSLCKSILDHWRKDINTKANRDKSLLRHMAFHYMARNKVCKAPIRNLRAKLKKAIRKQKKQKEHDHLQILAKASLAQHET